MLAGTEDTQIQLDMGIEIDTLFRWCIAVAMEKYGKDSFELLKQN